MGNRAGKKNVTTEMVADMVAKRKDGWTVREVADAHKVGRTTVSRNVNQYLRDSHQAAEQATSESLAGRLKKSHAKLTEVREANERLRATTNEQAIQIRKLEAERDEARKGFKVKDQHLTESLAARGHLQGRFEDADFGYRRKKAEVERLREAIVVRFLRENPAQE